MALRENRNFYIYVIFRPWDGTPCYIGKGSGKRYIAHNRSRERHANYHLANIYKKAGGVLPTVIIRDCLTEAEAFDVEVALIKAIGRGKGRLANMTNGGEGISGYQYSQEERVAHQRRQKEVMSRPDVRDKLRQSHLGSTFSEERRRNHKIAISKPELREANRQAHLGIKQSLATIEKRVSKTRGKKRSEEFRERMRQIRLGKVASDETRKKIGDVQRGRKQSRQTIERRRQTLLARQPDFYSKIGMLGAEKRWQSKGE